MEKSKEMPRFQLSVFLSQALGGYTCKLRHVTSDRVTTVTRTWVLKNVFFGWTILISYYWTRLLMELIRDRKKAPTFMIFFFWKLSSNLVMAGRYSIDVVILFQCLFQIVIFSDCSYVHLEKNHKYKIMISKQNLLTKGSYNTISARLTKQYSIIITMDIKATSQTSNYTLTST